VAYDYEKSLVSCACGCGAMFEPTDSHGRSRRYVSGHNPGRPPKARVQRECAYCGKPVEVHRCEALKYSRSFCDRTCASRDAWAEKHDEIVAAQQVGKDANLTGEWRECPECGDEFYTQPSIDKICCSRACRDAYCIGDKAPGWRGGMCSLQKKIRKSKAYRVWRKAVFDRDGYHCQDCGENTRDLRAHHKGIPFSVLLEQYQITSVVKARQCKELWDVSRGQTLCDDCHHKTDTYGAGAQRGRRHSA